MKVLHVSPAFFPADGYGGPIFSMYDLCLGLAEHGCAIRVLTSDANGHERVPTNGHRGVQLAANVHVTYLRRLHGTFAPQFPVRLPKFISWADVVHLTGVYSSPTIPTILLSRMGGVPLVWSTRGSLQRWSGSRKAALKTAFNTLSNIACNPQLVSLHATSTMEAKNNSIALPGLPCTVIPNSIEASVTSIARRPQDTFSVLFVGRLDPIKALENLIEAFALFRARYPRTRLIVAGSGPQEYVNQLKRRISELDLDDQVVFKGHVSGVQKEQVFREGDVLVLPSHSENFGMVVAEALAHGIPVIASRATPWEDIEQVGCGLHVPNDVTSLALALRAISQRDLIAMGEKGRIWVAKRFSRANTTKAMLELYTCAINRARSRYAPTVLVHTNDDRAQYNATTSSD